MMRRFLAPLILALALVVPSAALGSAPVLSQGDAFLIVPPVAGTNGTIVLTAVDTGLAPGTTDPLAAYVNATAVWTCSLDGSQTTVSKTEHETDGFLANRQGAAYGAIDLYPPLPDRTQFCVGGQIRVTSITYAGMAYGELTTGQVLSIPGTLNQTFP